MTLERNSLQFPKQMGDLSIFSSTPTVWRGGEFLALVNGPKLCNMLPFPTAHDPHHPSTLVLRTPQVPNQPSPSHLCLDHLRLSDATLPSSPSRRKAYPHTLYTGQQR